MFQVWKTMTQNARNPDQVRRKRETFASSICRSHYVSTLLLGCADRKKAQELCKERSMEVLKYLNSERLLESSLL